MAMGTSRKMGADTSRAASRMGAVSAGLNDDRPYQLKVVMTAEWPLK